MFEKSINYFLGLGICNCSICRKRNGKTATGILTNLANHRGYNSVHHYLESLHCKNEQDENSQNTSKPEVNQNELKSEMKADCKDEGKADKIEVNQNKVESETEMKEHFDVRWLHELFCRQKISAILYDLQHTLFSRIFKYRISLNNVLP